MVMETCVYLYLGLLCSSLMILCGNQKMDLINQSTLSKLISL